MRSIDAPSLAATRWHECKLRIGHDPGELYQGLAILDRADVGLFHHFTEPWHPGGWVVRVQLPIESEDFVLTWLEARPEVESVEPWSRLAHDERLYGDHFFFAMEYFHASSTIAAFTPLDQRAQITDKLIHCTLNAQGYGDWSEIRWAAEYLWKRIRLPFRLRWQTFRTGREWWK